MVTGDITTTSDQDMLKYEKAPRTGNNADQLIQTYVSSTTKSDGTMEYENQVWGFVNYYYVTKGDFNKKDVDGSVLPKNAKVTRMSLKGYNAGGKTTRWDEFDLRVVNIKSAKSNLNTSLGYRLYNGGGRFVPYFGKVTYNKTAQSFDASSTSDNLVNVINAPFGEPFVYEGEDVILNMYQLYNNAPMRFYYQTTEAELETASVFRTGWHAITAKGVDGFDSFEGKLNIPIDANTLPAFNLDYYTNDIRGTFVGVDNAPVKAIYRLTDNTTQKTITYEDTEDTGTFEFINLPHDHTYTLVVDMNEVAPITHEPIKKRVYENNYITFDGEKPGEKPAIYNDLKIELKGINAIVTAVNDVNAAAEVVSVKYYNVNGVELDEPANGINIKVTTLANGQRKTEKFVK